MNETTEIRNTVLVIESPAPRDVLDGRGEGEPLCAALKLAGIHVVHYKVVDRESLHEAFRRIINDTRTETHIKPGQMPRKTIVVPCFHFSAHGNADGIGLTSGEFLSWAELRSLLLDYALATGRVSENDKLPFAAQEVVFSACEGLNARKMFGLGQPYPCVAIIGPTVPVLWSDALTAFVTFYHLTITKGLRSFDVLSAMNASAGLDNVFQIFRCIDRHDMSSSGSARSGVEA